MQKSYVVQTTYSPEGKPPLVSYWYGPDHGWGTTAGPLSDQYGEIAAFTSRDHAERALKKVFGTLAEAKRRGYKVVADPRGNAVRPR